MKTPSRAIPWLFGFLAMFPSCDRPSPGDRVGEKDTVSVTDSSGVALVYSTNLLSDPWSLSSDPVVEIRPESSHPAALLYQVVGIAVLPDGDVAVANLGDNTVRLYASDSELLWKVGGSGQGPGEFRQVRGLVRRGSELWAFQPLPNPVNVFDLQGRYLRQGRSSHLGEAVWRLTTQ